MNRNLSINYLEIPSTSIAATKSFFSAVFDWSFIDYGESYVAFTTPDIEGGFYQSDVVSLTKTGGTFVVFYADDIERMASHIESAGGTISKPLFSFPGGRRFHFTEPGGSEFAVWTDKN